MGDSKKISKLLDKKAKAEEEVRRIHKLVFEVAKSDNTEMRILRNEFDRAKKQLNEINEEIEQLRQKDEVKSSKIAQMSTANVTATQEKTAVVKESKGIQELIRLVGNGNTSANKQVKSQPEPAQPSAKSKEINNLKKTTEVAKLKDNVDDEKLGDKNEVKKTKDAKKPQNELDKKTEENKKVQNELNTEEEKPKELRQRVKIDVINIRPPQTQKKIEPKPIIPSVRLR